MSYFPSLGSSTQKYLTPGKSSGLLTGLISYWKLEAASGTRVDSAGTNHLVPVNAPGNGAGIIGNALILNSGLLQYLTVANNATLTPGNALSISCWVNYAIMPTGATAIINKYVYSSDASWSAGLNEISVGNVGGLFYTALNSTDASPPNAITPAFVVINTWHHIVWVYDGSQVGNAGRLKCWVNGVSQTLTFTGVIPAALVANTSSFEIGRFSGLGRYVNGKVDEVALYSRALTSAEVASLYNSGSGLTFPFF